MKNKTYIKISSDQLNCQESFAVPLSFALTNGYKIVAVIQSSKETESFPVYVYDANGYPVSFKNDNIVRHDTKLKELIEIITWADSIRVPMETAK
jgi:hypothetical protein